MDELRRRAQPLLDHPPVARTPIDALRRRAARRRARRALAVAAVVLVAAIGGVTAVVVAAGGSSRSPRVTVEPTTAAPATTAAPPTTAALAIGAPSTFVSTRGERDAPGLVIALSDARTGKAIKTLYSVPDGLEVTGTAIAANGDVWVTVSRGPRTLGHTAGGNPQPHSCASTVLDIDPRTGRRTIVLSGGDDELIGDAQPSPTGDRVAYLHSGCATYWFDNSLQIRDVATGATVSIGAKLARCHFISHPRWTLDGQSLVVAYAPAVGPAYTGALGTCSESGPGALTIVSAEQSQDGLEGTSAAAPAGCAIDAVAVTSTGYASVEHCGSLYITGDAQLVRYDHKLASLSHSPVGVCEDGDSLAGDRSSNTVVLSAYEYCGGGTNGDPVTKLFVDTGGGPRQIAVLPGGFTAVDYISF